MKHSAPSISLLCSRSSLTALTFALLLAGCSSAPDRDEGGLPDNMNPNAGRYSQDKDSIPLRLPTEEELRDPEPTVEALSRGGNKPYNIYGVNYSPRTDVLQYEEEGIASWYGSKFHGHLTSNGEVYNVFAMTAAHKTLPLPSYVRVTNLDNYRTAIVRVNDRGPFHDNRIIDLSYSAAYKLGVFPGGTGRVKLELISSPAMASQESFATPIAKLPDIPYQPVTPSERPSRSNEFVERPYVPADAGTPPPPAAPVASNRSSTLTAATSATSATSASGCYIQLLASSDRAKVQRLGNELQQQLSVPTAIESVNGLFRLLAGPLQDNAQHVLNTLRSGEYPQAYFTNKNLCS